MRRLLPLALMFLAAAPGARAQWTQTAGPEGGYVRSIAADGQDVYAEFWNNWFYHHDGTSWIKGSNAIANHLFVADAAILGNTINNGAVRSTDNGKSWQPVGGDGPGMILTTDDGKVYGSRKDTILVSNDGGASWSIAGIPPAGATIDALGAHGDTLIAGSITIFSSFRSVDGGEHWTPISIDSAGLFSPAGITWSNNRFYAWFHQKGVYRSDDGGATWQQMNQGFPEMTGTYPFISSLAVAGDTIWASSTTDIFRFDGTTWEKMDLSYLEAGRFAGEGHNLYCGSNAGVFRSTDLGVTWSSMNSGLIATHVSSLAGVGNALLSNATNGLHRSTDGGTTWTTVSPINVEQFVVSGDMVYARTKGYTGMGIYRSADSGISWIASNDGIQESLNHMTSLAAADQNLVVGFYDVSSMHGSTRWVHGGIARSEDGGKTWTTGNSGFPSQTGVMVPVIDIATDGNSFLASTLAGLYRSVDGGTSWSLSQTGLPAQPTYRGAIAHLDGSYYITVERTIYRSTDGGETWEDYGTGLSPNDIMQGFSVAANRIFAHASSSEEPNNPIYMLSGDRWMNLNGPTPIFNGPTAIPEGTIFTTIAAQGKTLFAGSSAQGVWKFPLLSDTVLIPASSNDPGKGAGTIAMLDGSQPNPFSSTTSIRFQLPARAHVRLSVTDATGREVALLREETMDAGEKMLRFDGSALPSGVYFVRLMAGNRLQTAPIVLAR